MILNFVSNSIKFSPRDGVVQVILRILSIEDVPSVESEHKKDSNNKLVIYSSKDLKEPFSESKAGPLSNASSIPDKEIGHDNSHDSAQKASQKSEKPTK